MSPSQMRLRFDGAAVSPTESGKRVDVSFALAGQPIVTSAMTSEGVGEIHAAALATLDAIQQAVGNRFECVLADLDHVNALGKDLVAVLVNIDYGDRQVQFFGSCPVAGSEVDAAVKATLNATNRFFELAMKDIE